MDSVSMPLPLWLPTKLDFGLSKPKRRVLGNQFSGQVESVGKAVTRFKPGDPVFGYRGQAMGCYAEYVCMPEDGAVATKPANTTYEEAATIAYGALTALALLLEGGILPGAKVTDVIASTRGIPAGRDSISPNRHQEEAGMESMRLRDTRAPAPATVFPRGQLKGRGRVGEVKRSTKTPRQTRKKANRVPMLQR